MPSAGRWPGDATDGPDDELVLWDVPDEAAPTPARYVWLAGEARVVTGLRRRLLVDAGPDRSAVAFMGYWREGRAME